ncbi:MAG: apolipoprotein N-acyltransferase [Desulfovibrio sp.]|nr:apolipoprotein N-acyltransferase [Desulfovibrio sp.]
MSAIRLPPAVDLYWGGAGALALWLGFPNHFLSLPLLVLLWPLSLVVLGMRASGSMGAIRQGWLISWLGCSGALYWLALPVHHVGGLPMLLAIPCALCIAACLASAGGFFSLAAYSMRAFPTMLSAVTLALFWYLLEWCYAVTTGFPWLPLAGALAVWPVLTQAADTVGAYALGGLWLAAALLCLAALPPQWVGLPQSHSAAKRRPKGFCPIALLCALCLTTLLLGYGLWRLQHNPLEISPSGPDSMAALLVEGNVDQNQKWLPSFQRETVELYLKLTHEGIRASQSVLQPGPALIIWPETAMPFFFETNPLLSDMVRGITCASGLPLLFGAPGLGQQTGQNEPAIFNRAFLLGPEGNILGSYDKEHLVPFGEYLPQWLDWDFLEALLQGTGVYTEGTATAPLRHENLALGLLICYEAIFPWLAQERVTEGANILLDISNDGWFGHSPAARQHLYLTTLRALEQNRWLLRGTNTGISAVVDARGRLTVVGPQFRTGSLAVRARLESTPSSYHYLAPWLPGIAALLCLSLFLTGHLCHSSIHPQPNSYDHAPSQ